MNQTSHPRDLPDGQAVDLTIPGSESYLGLVRSVVGRAARIAGFTFDGIEDFSLAVDEAAVLLLAISPLNLRLTVNGLQNGELTAELSIHGAGQSWPTEDFEGDTGWQVLSALCDRVWVLNGPRGGGIGLSQRVR